MTERNDDAERRRRRGPWPAVLIYVALTGCGVSSTADGVSTGSIERGPWSLTTTPGTALVTPTVTVTTVPATSPTVPTVSTVPTTAPITPTTTGTTTPPTTTAVTTSTTTPVSPVPPVPAPPATVVPTADIADPTFSFLRASSDALARGNTATSVTVLRDGAAVFTAASGQRVDGGPISTDTPFVVASVSKLVTALTISRLAEAGLLDADAAVPWAAMGLPHDPLWNDVTVRELLAHTSGMPVARATWLDDPGPCSTPLVQALVLPPEPTRGVWRYSNGNYCALGLLVEHVTGSQLDAAARVAVFDPILVTGPHLTTDGVQPGDAPYFKNVARLDRLGGAGTWMASTDDIAAMLSAVSPNDRAVLAWPGVMADQYGWGHTGTVDGAKACAWVVDGGRTIVVGVVAGNRPSTGGGLCDTLVSALAVDLGVWAGEPSRTPI